MQITRRRFSGILGSAAASCAFGAACRLESRPTQPNDGRLTVVPRAGVATSVEGTRPLGIERGRDGLLQLPGNAASAQLPLLIVLHGANGSGEGMLRRIGSAASAAGVAVLAPDSRESTWDGVRDGFGRDVVFLDRALARVFDTVSVDPTRIAVGGFSDGATYALSLGIANGDLFPRVAAFSPGFVISAAAHGRPRFFVSHGRLDQILPIDQCSRDSLKDWGVDPDLQDKIVRPVWAPDPAKWFSASDYPPAMIASRKVSEVNVRLLVDAAGRVTKCTSLTHFDSPTTVRSTAVALPRLIDDLRARGYELVTVTDLLTQ